MRLVSALINQGSRPDRTSSTRERSLQLGLASTPAPLYGWFSAYDLKTHTEIWRIGPGKDISDGSGQPIVTDGDAIYVTYLRGVVVTFAASDGKVRSIANDFDIVSSIALGSDRFFAPGDHALWAYAK
jgi:hypothetical protein